MAFGLGGSGVLAWIFRWFENRAAQKETVANQAMNYIGIMNAELDDVRGEVKSLREDVRALRVENAYLRQGIGILSHQLKKAGYEPEWSPDTGATPPMPVKPEKSAKPPRGFRP